ncbi:MAG: hypothetical protein WC683_02790 [bacterium]
MTVGRHTPEQEEILHKVNEAVNRPGIGPLSGVYYVLEGALSYIALRSTEKNPTPYEGREGTAWRLGWTLAATLAKDAPVRGEDARLVEAVAAVTARAGCGDNSCMFITPHGMATNGGCRCCGRGDHKPGLPMALAQLYKVALDVVKGR